MSARTITNPATGSALSSAVIRNELQLLENEIAVFGTPVYEEMPSGSGTSFTLAHTPLTGTLRVYRGGARQQSGAGNDYTLSGTTITLANALGNGEVLLADYAY